MTDLAKKQKHNIIFINSVPVTFVLQLGRGPMVRDWNLPLLAPFFCHPTKKINKLVLTFHMMADRNYTHKMQGNKN